ncbi:hypothetical protein [Thermus thermamylovorans]|uniref:Outer membrane protein beta-barrel domain-containing protein n=1 Tax=Thermus thermamylovorans TaxID=2509362 RepID=A0A4V2IVB3_9DEIN|nr:hypothetical protein [Thermus thermamylovorans]TBH21730.1 hypothetical protein ETP66_00365 [Thermus thermamylovorans]
MKKLFLAVLLALGLAFAQSPYAGGHLGLFGGGGVNLFNIGLHAGMPLGPGMPEVRAGLDFTSAAGVLITGFSGDVLLPLAVPDLPATPYLGAGANFWLFAGNTDFGVHGTLGIRASLPGTPVVGFVEFQPTYAFGGGGAFLYYLKVGANFGF